MNDQWFYISRLIANYLAGTITSEEESELLSWKEKSLENEQLFNKLLDKANLQKHKKERASLNIDAGWDAVLSKRKAIRKKRTLSLVYKCAAILTLPLILGITIYIYTSQVNEVATESTLTPIANIQPGSKQAQLILDDNQVIELDSLANQTMYERDGTKIEAHSGMINYTEKAKKEASKKVIFNQMVIPHGGEYKLTLSDGTRVHLNAMSSIRFPVVFSADKRIVEITGEAYFEVAKDGKPFIVQTPNMAVEVLGTSFNISSYQNEPCQTTLVSGSIKLATLTGTERILKPSEQAVYDINTEAFFIQKVDPHQYTSWTTGKIICKDERLEDILKKLSRWYEIDVSYLDEAAKDIRFGCNLNRYDDITPFISLLEDTRKVRIRQEGNRIELQSRE